MSPNTQDSTKSSAAQSAENQFYSPNIPSDIYRPLEEDVLAETELLSNWRQSTEEEVAN